jgi:signal transduction histidine kinase
MTSDGQLTDTLRLVASDPIGDKRVKKKLALVLGAWREQYQDDPSMAYFANLYKQCRISERLKQADMYSLLGAPPLEEDKRKMEKAKLKEKRAAKERARAEEEERARAAQKPRTRRVPFDFERVSYRDHWKAPYLTFP